MVVTERILLKNLIIHGVGNPSRAEELRLSAEQVNVQDEQLNAVLKKYFLASFNESALYRFTHMSDVNLNEIYTYLSGIFEDADSFEANSKLIATFLYNKSTHVKVKQGEMYLAYFQNLPFEGDEVSGIGIFKSENRDTYLTIYPEDENLSVAAEAGINVNKLDKGCLVFRTEGQDGYRVCVVDNTNKQQDAQYWVDEFLQISPLSDSYHQTDKYLNLCKQFITNEYPEKFEVNKSDQVELLGRSMEYFKTKEQFSLEEFASEVIHHDEVKDSFMQYKKNFESARNFEINDEFDISLSAVKKQQSAFKTVLKLDKNFHIYIHGRRDLIERGIDEMNGKKFYKIYYEEEQ